MKDKIISRIIEEAKEKSFVERLSKEVVSTIFQAIGLASTCWSDVDKAGDFDTQRAHDIGVNLCSYIADLIDQERDYEAGYIESAGAPLETILLHLSHIEEQSLEGGK